MELFKKLDWNWYSRYENSEIGAFELVNENQDVFAKTLNEISDHVRPVFKKTATNSSPTTNSLSDPRTISGTILEELKFDNCIYKSRLTKQEHNFVMKTEIERSKNSTAWNGNLVKPENIRSITRIVARVDTQQVHEKHDTEEKAFNKFVQSCFHKNLQELRLFTNQDLEKFAISVWFESFRNLSDEKHQSIMRYQENTESTFNYKISLLDSKVERNSESTLKISEVDRTHVPVLNSSFKDLVVYFKIKSEKTNPEHEDDFPQSDLILGSNFFEFFADSTKKFLKFEVKDDSIVEFDSILPNPEMSKLERLKISVKHSLLLALELRNFDEYIKELKSPTNDNYRLVDHEDYLLKKFQHYHRKISHQSHEAFRINLNSTDSFKMLVRNKDIFFMSEKETKKKVVVSVKLEFQSKFGAEQMAKEELIQEFLESYFNDAMVLRYRIDVKYLTVLSVKLLKHCDIEEELKKVYGISRESVFNNLFNFFNCVLRLPTKRYLIEKRFENQLTNLMVSVAVESNENNSNNLFDLKEKYEAAQHKINDDFSDVEWKPISREITLLHLHKRIASRCFPYWIKGRNYVDDVKNPDSSRNKAKAIPKKVPVVKRLNRKPRKRKQAGARGKVSNIFIINFPSLQIKN